MTEAGKQNAADLLSGDHRRIESLFDKFELARGAKAKQEIAHDLCRELNIHTRIEEEVFYPTLRGKVDADMLDDAYVEHDGVKVLVNEIEAAAPSEGFYDAKVRVLRDEITNHIREEERSHNSLFAQARQAGVDLDALGARLASRRRELADMAGNGALGPARMATLHHPEAFRPSA